MVQPGPAAAAETQPPSPDCPDIIPPTPTAYERRLAVTITGRRRPVSLSSSQPGDYLLFEKNKIL